VDVGEEIDDSVDEEGEGAALPAGRPIQIAVMGRPNSGKSTLVNAILGEERLLTGPEAGITRDAIAVQVDWRGTPFRIFDTAGMRKKAKVQGKLEKLSVSDALRAVKFAEVVVVLLDVQAPFESQDLRLADLAEREGRAVVVAVNKWDLEAEKQRKLAELREAFGRLLPQLRGAPMVMVSALTGQGLDRLHDAIIKAYAVWNTRISTARLNRWLAAQTAEHPPPAPGGRRIRLRYMTQVKTRPPTFVLFASQPDEVPEDYKRFLVNGLRRDFDMPGTPIRLHLRAGENPYAGRRKPNVTALDKHKPRRLEG
jgi:GTP-binding protein